MASGDEPHNDLKRICLSIVIKEFLAYFSRLQDIANSNISVPLLDKAEDPSKMIRPSSKRWKTRWAGSAQ